MASLSEKLTYRASVCQIGLLLERALDEPVISYDLDDREIAIVERIPIRVETASPVNLHVSSIDDGQATVLLSGIGEVTLNGKRIMLNGSQQVTIDLAD